MAEPAEKRWTVEEFLAWDDGTDRRYELVDGRIMALAPPSEAHAAIVINLGGESRSRLRPPCRVLAEFGVRLPDRDDSFYQFDLAVTCAPTDPARRYVAEPELIIEVLSPSTALHDRGRKLDHYRQLPSLKEILLVASEERRVQHWHRDGTRWVVDDLIGDADLRLGTVPGPIPLAAIYEGSGGVSSKLHIAVEDEIDLGGARGEAIDRPCPSATDNGRMVPGERAARQD